MAIERLYPSGMASPETSASVNAPALTPAREPLASVPVDGIAVVGCGGSGKSHLARVLDAQLDIKPVHLDAPARCL